MDNKIQIQKCYNVVAAVIVQDGKYLCLQKGETKYDYTSYKYEFPGGKVEKGETQPQALKREIMEEMEFEISVGSKIITIEHQYPDFGIVMSAYLCEPLSSYFKLTEHISADWKSVEELNSLNWADADVKVVYAIMANLK